MVNLSKVTQLMCYLNRSYCLFQWFPNFAAHWNPLENLKKNIDTWLLTSDILIYLIWGYMTFSISFFFFWLHRAASGILVPQSGIEPRPPAVEPQNPNH